VSISKKTVSLSTLPGVVISGTRKYPEGRRTIREIEVSLKKLTAYMGGHLIPEIKDSPAGDVPHVLSSYRPPTNSDWTLQMRGSHRRVITLDWCISTMALFGKEVEECVDAVALLLPRTNQEYDVLKKVYTSFSKSTPDEIEEDSETNVRFTALYNFAKRIHYGCTPKVDFLKMWDPIRVKPKAYIGVGYSDKGHLGTSPSWQDQMISAEDGNLPNTSSFFEMILSL
jgi:hypothetical protein